MKLYLERNGKLYGINIVHSEVDYPNVPIKSDEELITKKVFLFKEKGRLVAVGEIIDERTL